MHNATHMTLKIVLFFSLFLFADIASASVCGDNQNYFTEKSDVKLFIKQMVKEHHFDTSELYHLFSTVKLRPKIIQSTKTPLEQKPWYTYRLFYVTEERIKQGVSFWDRFEDSLTKAEKMFGVPASIIVATIGVESRYGKNIGEYPVIDALINLSFEDMRRADFFRKELEEFLLLARDKQLDPTKVIGSYAGAIGQPQFMPSSFRNYAISFSNKKEIDLTHNELDVIASIANYYYKNGWLANEPIARPLNLGGGQYQFSLTKLKPMTRSKLLITDKSADASNKKMQDSLIVIRGNYGNEYWIGFHNFDVIKRYNHSILYAMAVYQLSYYINALREDMKKCVKN